VVPYAKADKMFMRTVQQIVFLILLNSVPVTFVTDPELLIKPSVPVMTHSLDQSYGQKGEGKKVPLLCSARLRSLEIS